jgi:HTH-type transcriptional regulator / antitoxin HipB
MKTIDKKLPGIESLISKDVGAIGTQERMDFTNEALALNYAILLKEKRQEMHLTQEQLAKKVGKQRSYIARLEQGNVDMQLSTLISICSALNLKFSLE